MFFGLLDRSPFHSLSVWKRASIEEASPPPPPPPHPHPLHPPRSLTSAHLLYYSRDGSCPPHKQTHPRKKKYNAQRHIRRVIADSFFFLSDPRPWFVPLDELLGPWGPSFPFFMSCMKRVMRLDAQLLPFLSPSSLKHPPPLPVPPSLTHSLTQTRVRIPISTTSLPFPALPCPSLPLGFLYFICVLLHRPSPPPPPPHTSPPPAFLPSPNIASCHSAFACVESAGILNSSIPSLCFLALLLSTLDSGSVGGRI